MHPQLQTNWDDSEYLRQDILARVRAIPEGRQKDSGQPGDWSALQLVAHLRKAESVVAGDSVPDDKHLVHPNPFVIRLLCWVMSAGIPVPAPSIMEPDSDPEPLIVQEKLWDLERATLRRRFESTGPDVPFGVHPVFGILTAIQVSNMMKSHLIYHSKRFRRP